jgi:hypothetical protein
MLLFFIIFEEKYLCEEIVWEEDVWCVRIHPLVKVFSSGEEVCDRVCGAWNVF